MLLIFVDRKMLLILSEEERNVASPSSRDIGCSLLARSSLFLSSNNDDDDDDDYLTFNR